MGSGGSGRNADRDPAFALGMKIYDNDWYLRFGLGYEQAAALLAEWGVTFVIAQSRLLPMPDSAVKSAVPPELAERYGSYDDRRFRDALARRGILYIASCLMFFDPEALAGDPSLAAIDRRGRPMQKQDWYIGIPPTRAAHVAAKVARIETAVRTLEPDGIHLGFMRWPGFWELWMPHHTPADFPDYSYDAASLRHFEAATGVSLPSLEPVAAAAWIADNARRGWVDWKCRVVFVIARVRAAVKSIAPDIRLMLNTLPFGRSDFDNAVESVFGQRFEWLAEVVDVFEVMAYHQILKRPPEWPAAIGSEVKARSCRTTVCTLQAAPLYLDGMHAREGRSRTLPAEEFAAASGAVARSGVDGQVFFLWSDFLRQAFEHDDWSRVDVIRKLARSDRS